MLSFRTAILCASLIILGSGALTIPLGKRSANATPVFTSAEPTGSPATSAAPGQPSPSISRLLSRRIQQDLAQRLNVAPSAIAIVESAPKTWPDQCLGLARPNERCRDGEVHGWQIQVKSAQQQWVYRSDRAGHLLRLEPLAGTPDFGSGDFSTQTSQRLLKAVSKQVNQPLTKLQILEVQPATWNGCLGIFEPDRACTEQAIAGFRTIVSDGQATWVYHFSENGDQIAQNAAASGAQRGVKTTFFPLNLEPPTEPDLSSQIVFESKTSGGLVASVRTTALTTDGTLYREQTQPRNGSAPPTRTVIRRLSPSEVKAFQNLLQQQHFPSLNNMSYLTEVAVSDYPTTQLQAPGTKAGYIDLEAENLPPDLREIIAGWKKLER